MNAASGVMSVRAIETLWYVGTGFFLQVVTLMFRFATSAHIDRAGKAHGLRRMGTLYPFGGSRRFPDAISLTIRESS